MNRAVRVEHTREDHHDKGLDPENPAPRPMRKFDSSPNQRFVTGRCSSHKGKLYTSKELSDRAFFVKVCRGVFLSVALITLVEVVEFAGNP